MNRTLKIMPYERDTIFKNTQNILNIICEISLQWDVNLKHWHPSVGECKNKCFHVYLADVQSWRAKLAEL